MPLSLRLALRELRGGLSGLRVLLACLALGVFAIAAAGSLTRAIQAGLEADAQALLGGDLVVERRYQPPDAAEQAALEALATPARVATLRAMAVAPGEAGARALVDLKAVGDGYPLYGTVTLTGGGPLAEALARRDSTWGAVAAPNLLDRLGLAVGDRLRLGSLTLEVRDTLAREPDRTTSLFSLGPRLMISLAALPDTGLVRPGSLVTWETRLRADQGVPPARIRARLTETFPEAGWRLRGTDQAAAGLTRFLETLTLFLTLVGLTALLVGGIGVANATGAWLRRRMTTIATLKCLGAPAALIFRVYLIQIGVLALLGIGVGVAGGAVTPWLVQTLAADLLPVRTQAAIYPGPLLLAATFGALTALVFALWPLARARDIPALALVKGADTATDPARRWPRRRDLLGLAVALAALVILTVASADDPRFALGFTGGAAVAMGVFALAAVLVRRLARAAGPLAQGRPGLRLALANLHRPGAATGPVVLSLGLGLSVLVIVALIQGNLAHQIDERLPDRAPSFFFIDLQPDQVDPFRAVLAETGGAAVAETAFADMVRGRITALNGVPVAEATVDPDVAWALRGDRGFTTAATPPEGTTLVRGTWWPEDHAGPARVSLPDDLAAGLGLDIGDTLTVNILGREITGTLANTRRVDWGSLRINFTFVVSPDALAGAPRSWIATVRLDGDAATETAVERAVTDALPNVSAIRVKNALESVRVILDGAARAITASAAVTLLAGGLVLAGAMAAGHGRRVYESVVLKVLGATRGALLRGYLLEYGLLGLATGAIAAAVGTAGAWAVVVFVMDTDWVFLPDVLILTLVACVLVTLTAGYLGTWRALSGKAGPWLRNE
ncbi:ABC transporter permease [Roseospira visakhapatnamensis]|uniref:Putative ABC transport system permease protein n=1 Tax=Roseospira visakhapatnamensis TaxID=390880 RepID=A0A7W6RCT3_9PROT|nr:FtsX-like permease family protein [Roseospira visakhapatnamensis]MBB4266063.1 putative ABC transport system permease protein [Roseospira visakhapatnamensis]